MAIVGCADSTPLSTRAAYTPACDDCRITRTITGWLEEDEGWPDAAAAPVGADSLVRADRAGLLRIVGRGGTQVDSIFLPHNVRIRSLRVLRWPDGLVFSGHALGRNDLFRAGVREGFLIIDTTFQAPDVAAGVRLPDYRLFDRDGALWAVEARSYTILQFDRSGTLSQRVVRSPPWFGKGGGRPSGGHRSSVRAISVDEHGRLWVYATQPTDSARVAWRSPEARRAGGTVGGEAEDLYETIVEVLEADARTLIAHGRIAAPLAGVTPDGHTLFRERKADGTPGTSVQRLQLHEPE